MKPEWKTFLTDNGAEFSLDNENQVASFGNPVRENRVTVTGDTLCDLSHLGLIQVYGDDARAFLQSQTSNDIHQVGESQSQLSAYCNPKGRMLASFRVFQRSDTFYLVLPRELLEDTMKRLRMFVMMSKVTLEDADDTLVRFGFSGPTATRELEVALGAKAPVHPDRVTEHKGVTMIRAAGEIPRFELYGELDSLTELWSNLNVRAAPVGASSWRLLDILAGIPTVYRETKEALIPQMVNLEVVGGVSFKKGCYPGQEIVARMHYLGKPKRRMFRLQFDSSTAPLPGTPIFSSTDSTGQPIGSIVSSAPFPEGGYTSLAVVALKHVEQGADIYLESNTGPVAVLHPPPYEFPDNKKQ